MKKAAKIIRNLLVSQKSQMTKKENKIIRLEKSRSRALKSILSPLRKLVKKWNNIPRVMNFLHAVFKEHGLYKKGDFLLEIFSQKEKSPNFSVFLSWNVHKTKVGVLVYKTTMDRKEFIIDELLEPSEFDDQVKSMLKTIITFSEKDLLKMLVKNYPPEEEDIKPILSKKAIDMTSEHRRSSSKEEWKNAHLELSPTGYFDGKENIYCVLCEAEKSLLLDAQKIIVLGTKITYNNIEESEPGERYLVERRITVGYLRRMFLNDESQPFTLEWYANYNDWQLTRAIMARNRAPIIMMSPASAVA